ncbi:MAG: DNA polymerase III subunit gamma/tau, partial [Blautia sp.]|nr:DNA polymerase III subunit gamma/tau [Blautia sp.]
LSGQLRFATQKRVLTEVALIRLCRPQMEVGLDSVLDRLRVLEERVANGVVAAAPQAAETGAAPVPAPAAKPAARKAAPEDLQKIVAGWKAVTGRIRSGVFRKSLESAIPKFGENEGAGTLFVVFRDFLGKNYTEDPVWRDELREAIRQTSGTDVDVRFMVEGEQSRPDLEVIDVDERIHEMIHFPVETVPDEE